MSMKGNVQNFNSVHFISKSLILSMFYIISKILQCNFFQFSDKLAVLAFPTNQVDVYHDEKKITFYFLPSSSDTRRMLRARRS